MMNTIAGGFSYGRLSSHSLQHHSYAIRGIDVNCVDIQLSRSLFPITFTNRDFKGINLINQDDPMVFSNGIANFMVSKFLNDQGSSSDILYWKTFQRLEISPAMIQPQYGPFLGFSRERVETRGYVDLMTTIV
ncbi:hypothetical protein JHK86_000703 [Glycine max]|nr:hypothetical protein JHK86_000703 [Glycine max]